MNSTSSAPRRLLVWSVAGGTEPLVSPGIGDFDETVVFGIGGPDQMSAAGRHLMSTSENRGAWATAGDWCLFSAFDPASGLADIAAMCGGTDDALMLFPRDGAERAEADLFREVDAAVAVAACRAETIGVVGVRGDVAAGLWGVPSRVELDHFRRLTLAAVGTLPTDASLPLGPSVVTGPWPDGAPPRMANLPGLGEDGTVPRDFEREFVDGLDVGDLVHAGLLLIQNDIDAAHRLAQAHEGNLTADYWHAIVHRRECDYGNAAYWFRRAQRHPVLAKLARDGVAAGEPFAFLDICRRHVGDGSRQEALAREAQWVEMLTLLRHTALDTA